MTATREARARAKIQLVDIIRNAAKTNPNHAQWLLERSWPGEYARTERVEQIGEKPDAKSVGCSIFYDVGNGTLAQLLNFPIDPSMKQVEGKTPNTVADQALPDAISDAPAPNLH